MYTQITRLGLKDYLARECPALVTAFVIAELFYKFHSFTLECLMFLATWGVLSWLQSKLLSLFTKR
jgi:hypothetical protein